MSGLDIQLNLLAPSWPNFASYLTFFLTHGAPWGKMVAVGYQERPLFKICGDSTLKNPHDIRQAE